MSGFVQAQVQGLSFFVSSEGVGAAGGNFGGLAGADALCDTLATAVGAGDRTWAAFFCAAWTSNAADAFTVVGHSDGNGPQGVDENFGWVRAHPAGNDTACSQDGLAAGGGDGRIYCFAAD